MDRDTFQRAAALTDMLTTRWFAPVSAAMSEFAISTPARQAAFIAQARHESGGIPMKRPCRRPASSRSRTWPMAGVMAMATAGGSRGAD